MVSTNTFQKKNKNSYSDTHQWYANLQTLLSALKSLVVKKAVPGPSQPVYLVSKPCQVFFVDLSLRLPVRLPVVVPLPVQKQEEPTPVVFHLSLHPPCTWNSRFKCYYTWFNPNSRKNLGVPWFNLRVAQGQGWLSNNHIRLTTQYCPVIVSSK